MRTTKNNIATLLSNPIAVVISDIHFSLNNLELATMALESAYEYANNNGLPLIIAGDLQDTKAIIRAEVANRLIKIINRYAFVSTYVLVGNHDLINEKAPDHALNYLKAYVCVIENPTELFLDQESNVTLIPYQQDVSIFDKYKDVENQIFIIHQGAKTAFMGDYIQDKTSYDFKDYKSPIISGHYHRHQTVGPLTYIGSPYTMSFGEANDGPKGFLVLKEDGYYERHILHLRKHVILETTFEDISKLQKQEPEDLVWVKVTGTRKQLQSLKKEDLGELILGHCNFKLDLIPSDQDIAIQPQENKTAGEILDYVFQTHEDGVELKKLWEELQ